MMKINVREGDGENQKTKESYKPRGKAGFSDSRGKVGICWHNKFIYWHLYITVIKHILKLRGCNQVESKIGISVDQKWNA